MLGILVQGYCVYKARNHKNTMSGAGKGNMVTFALTIIHSADIFGYVSGQGQGHWKA